jgi:hypothetical protein
LCPGVCECTLTRITFLRAQVKGGRRSRLDHNIWNMIDVASSTCLVVGATCHFTQARTGVQTVGALGVALKWMGFVDFLRAFEATGSLVRMVSVSISRYQTLYPCTL